MHLTSPVTPTTSSDNGMKSDRHIAFKAISGSYKNSVELPKIHNVLHNKEKKGLKILLFFNLLLFKTSRSCSFQLYWRVWKSMLLLKAYLNLSIENNARVLSVSPEYLRKFKGATYLLPQTMVDPFLLSKWASDALFDRSTPSKSAFQDFFWNGSYKNIFFAFLTMCMKHILIW